jgi:hypothetical protein
MVALRDWTGNSSGYEVNMKSEYKFESTATR